MLFIRPSLMNLSLAFRPVSGVLLTLMLLLPLAAAAQPPPSDSTIILFDGATLGQWKDSEYGFPNLIEVRDSTLVIGMADGLSGVTWTGDYPRMNYEISLEAQRQLGGDFFVGLTFPIADAHATLIVGGWAGVVVGLSSIDGLDASENDWSTLQRFENDRWYHIRLRVTSDAVRAWIDGEQVLDIPTTGHRFSIRPDVTPSLPLGFATWRTTAALRHIHLRHLLD